jgi:osmotically-inducible protein OsmY
MGYDWWRGGAAMLLAAGLSLGVLPGCDRPQTAADADNTARNVRDRDERTATPLDQGLSQGDQAITQHIRKVVMEHSDKLSTNAENVKIVTQDGVVTLRGPVDTAQEKAVIVAVAQAAPGVKRVDDQLEVEAH